MISCSELRIGNYVMADISLREVSAINNTTVSAVYNEKNSEQLSSGHSLENILPVPLTNAHLEQCGFIYHDYFKFWQLVTTGSQR